MAHISNRLRFETFFIFILSFENGSYHRNCHRKVVTYKNSQRAMIRCNYKTKNLKLKLYAGANVLGSWCSQKMFLKNFANFTGKHPCRVKSEPKSLIYPCSLHLYFKRDSFTQLFFSEFCRIFKNSFFRALLGECPWLYIWHI